VARIRSQGVQAFLNNQSAFIPSFPSSAHEVAFKLVVLFQLLLILKKSTYRGDIWEQWSEEQNAGLNEQVLESCIFRTWTDYLDTERSDHDIEHVLWTSFLLEERKPAHVRGAVV